MKVVTKLAVLLGVGALLPFAASAKSTEELYLENASKAPGVPVPVAVVSPTNVSTDYIGAKVDLAFTVDAQGKPIDFMIMASPDAVLAKTVMDAVSKWRFTPAQKNGTAVAKKVVLPVRISSDETRFAAN